LRLCLGVLACLCRLIEMARVEIRFSTKLDAGLYAGPAFPVGRTGFPTFRFGPVQRYVRVRHWSVLVFTSGRPIFGGSLDDIARLRSPPNRADVGKDPLSRCTAQGDCLVPSVPFVHNEPAHVRAPIASIDMPLELVVIAKRSGFDLRKPHSGAAVRAARVIETGG
jgi:hypothetical protein